jgi:hypothetical protein
MITFGMAKPAASSGCFWYGCDDRMAGMDNYVQMSPRLAVCDFCCVTATSSTHSGWQH